MSDVRDELREQFHDAFDGANFPVSSPMELVPALPDGPGTTFEAGDFSMTAMEMATEIREYQDFPYESADDLVDDVFEALDDNDLI